MSGIVKFIMSFSEKVKTSLAIERSKPGSSGQGMYVSELKKHLMEFLGLKEQAYQYGIGGFSLKLFRLAKSPSGKWGTGQLELPNLISDESSSELNGKCGTLC